MKKSSLAVLLTAVVAAFALPSVAAEKKAAKQPMPGVVIADVARVDAEVAAIDAKSRVVTLKMANGDAVDLVAGPEIRNFDQLRVGDRVGAEYQQALSMKLKKGPGVRSTVEDQAAVRAQPGQKPGGAVAKQIDFVADVTDVDTKAKIVTLLGAKGTVVHLKIEDPKVLAKVKKGDQVEGTFVQTVAIAVVRKPAEAK